MRVIIEIIRLIAWRIAHAYRTRRPPCPLVSPYPYHGLLSGPTEGPGCVTDDASEHGRSRAGRMPASPSGARHSGTAKLHFAASHRQHTRAACAAAVEKRGDFIAVRGYPLVITGQGDFVQEYFG